MKITPHCQFPPAEQFPSSRRGPRDRFMCFLSFHSLQPREIGPIFISLFRLGPFGHREVSLLDKVTQLASGRVRTAVWTLKHGDVRT